MEHLFTLYEKMRLPFEGKMKSRKRRKKPSKVSRIKLKKKQVLLHCLRFPELLAVQLHYPSLVFQMY